MIRLLYDYAFILGSWLDGARNMLSAGSEDLRDCTVHPDPADQSSQ